jgi:hypothetical protein
VESSLLRVEEPCREEKHWGGNVFFTPASNTISKVGPWNTSGAQRAVKRLLDLVAEIRRLLPLQPVLLGRVDDAVLNCLELKRA